MAIFDRFNAIDADALRRMESLGRSGLTVSVCCGPAGTSPFRWTVQVLSRDGEEFAQPYAADSFAHCITIAEQECRIRGWIQRSVEKPA